MATLTELQDDLALYKAARRRILEGSQEASQGDQRVRLADLGQIEKTITDLERRIAMLRAAQGGSVSHSVAVFRGRRS